jgi:hypothetical protein
MPVSSLASKIMINVSSYGIFAISGEDNFHVIHVKLPLEKGNLPSRSTVS